MATISLEIVTKETVAMTTATRYKRQVIGSSVWLPITSVWSHRLKNSSPILSTAPAAPPLEVISFGGQRVLKDFRSSGSPS